MSCLKCMVFMFSALLALVTNSHRSTAAEPQTALRLEDYLKSLGYFAIPLQVGTHKNLLLPAKINDRACTFLVDSGWGLTALDVSMARGLKTLAELGVELDDKFFETLPKSSVVVLDRLTMGGARFQNQPARVRNLELDYIPGRHGGILGCDFLLRNHCLVDCAGRKLYFRSEKRSSEQSEALAKTLEQSGFVRIPLRSESEPVVQAKLNGDAKDMLVDTGGDLCVLHETEAKRLELRPIRKERAATGSYIPAEEGGRVVGVGAIGAHRAWIARLESLEIGPRKWSPITIGVANLDKWGIKSGDKESPSIHGLLGINLLAAEGALIDLPASALWLRSNPVLANPGRTK